MADEIGAQQIVFTLAARCRDCYRCLRACPVKAIRMKNGQAYVDEQRCIACGTCIRECPQQAKSFRQDVETVERLVESGRFLAASIAPSFAAVFNGWQRKRLPAALRALGFGYVGQTSQGAYQVSAHTARLLEQDESKTYVATACPAVVNYVEKYRHDLVADLLPLASPMAVHGRMLKRLHGQDCAVVFIGPCVAKKSEILRPAVAGSIDCVLTFKELAAWLEKRGIDLSRCEESDFDEKALRDAQLYPLPGGSIKCAELEDDGLSRRIVRIDGMHNIREVLTPSPRDSKYALIEPLFCNQGCINGPGINIDKNTFERRREIIEYNQETSAQDSPPLLQPGDLLRTSFKKDLDLPPVSEEEIQAILESTGKSDPQQQLNCGACGYDTCRDKAIARCPGHGRAGDVYPLYEAPGRKKDGQDHRYQSERHRDSQRGPCHPQHEPYLQALLFVLRRGPRKTNLVPHGPGSIRETRVRHGGQTRHHREPSPLQPYVPRAHLHFERGEADCRHLHEHHESAGAGEPVEGTAVTNR